MNTKFQNKANLLEAVSSKLEAFPPNKPIYRVNFVNPVKKPNEPKSNSCFGFRASDFGFSPYIHASLYSCLLLNEPNFSVFGLKMRVFAENKPNLQPSIINQEFRNEANSISQFSIKILNSAASGCETNPFSPFLIAKPLLI